MRGTYARLHRRSTAVFLATGLLVLVTAGWPGHLRSIYLAAVQAAFALVAAAVVFWPERARGDGKFAGDFASRPEALRSVLDLVGRSRPGGRPGAPNAVLIHGMAGVGKTTLARQAAHALIGSYPDGYVRVGLTDAGEPLASGELLTMVLRVLGWPDEIPASAAERTTAFRAFVAGKRILFLFDDAREPSQLSEVLPHAPESAVIITSRRNLAPQLGVPGYALRPLPPVGAVDLLCGITDQDGLAMVEPATRLVLACGRLPVALQALGARVVYDGDDLAALTPAAIVADLGRPVPPQWAAQAVAGIVTEFARLSRLERDALCLLTQVRSPSFASWVLGPLLRVSAATSDVIATTLAGARLLEPAGRDDRFELARYRFHPLVRIFAEGRLNQNADLASACRDALDRLRAAYLELARSALGGSTQHPLPAFEAAHDWIPETSPRAGAAASLAWVRWEQASLWDEALTLLEDHHDFGLRLVAQFTEPHPAADEVFARTGGFGIASSLELDVRLARIRILLVAGRYAESEALIAAARTAAARPELARRRADLHLIAAEVYGELRWCKRAKTHVAKARALLGRLPAAAVEARLRTAEQLADPHLNGPLPDDPYWAAIVSAARHHASGRHRSAIGDLAPLAERAYEPDWPSHDDAHRRTMLHRHLAVAHDELCQQPGSNVQDNLVAGARHAVLAVIAAETTGNRWEHAYGRLLLARALTAQGRNDDARLHARRARDRLPERDEVPPYILVELDRTTGDRSSALPA